MNLKFAFSITILFLSISHFAKAAGGISAGGLPGSPTAVCHYQLGGDFQTGRSLTDIAPLCTIAGGTVEYWTLFRVVKADEQPQAIQTFLNSEFRGAILRMKNKENVIPFCRLNGGEIETWQDASKQDLEMCIFPDKSGISALTLLGGPKKYPKLARILSVK